jgi:hypothetical protein
MEISENTNQKPITNPRTAKPAELPPQDNIDKVRDILFGSRLHEMERQLTRAQERFTADLDRHHHDLVERLEALETYFKQELKALSDQVKGEQLGRSRADTELSTSLNDFNAKANKSQGEIRELILDRAKTLRISQKWGGPR